MRNKGLVLQRIIWPSFLSYLFGKLTVLVNAGSRRKPSRRPKKVSYKA